MKPNVEIEKKKPPTLILFLLKVKTTCTHFCSKKNVQLLFIPLADRNALYRIGAVLLFLYFTRI